MRLVFFVFYNYNRVPWSFPGWVTRLLGQLTLLARLEVTAEVTLVPVSPAHAQGITPWDEKRWSEMMAAHLPDGSIAPGEHGRSLIGIACDRWTLPKTLCLAVRAALNGHLDRFFLCGPGALAVRDRIEADVPGLIGAWEGSFLELPQTVARFFGREADDEEMARDLPRLAPAFHLVDLTGCSAGTVPVTWDSGEPLRAPDAVAADLGVLSELGVRELLVALDGAPETPSWWKSLATALETQGNRVSWALVAPPGRITRPALEIAKAAGCGRVFLHTFDLGMLEEEAGTRTLDAETLLAEIRAIEQVVPVAQVSCLYKEPESPDEEEEMEQLHGFGESLVSAGHRIAFVAAPPPWPPPDLLAIARQGKSGWIWFDSSFPKNYWKERKVPTTFGREILAALEDHPKLEILKFCDGDRVVTQDMAGFWEEVEVLAAGLVELGVEKGRFLFFCRCRSPKTVPLAIAACAIGAIPVGYSRIFLQTPVEMIRLVDPVICVVDHLEELRDAREMPVRTLVLNPSISPGRAPGPSISPEDGSRLSLETVSDLGRTRLARDPDLVRRLIARVTPSDPATLFFSSGTTGPSKPVLLPHGHFFGPATRRWAAGWTLLSPLPFGGHKVSIGFFATYSLGFGCAYAVADPTRSAEENCRLFHPDLLHLLLAEYQTIAGEIARLREETADLETVRREIQRRYGENVRALLAVGMPVSPFLEENLSLWAPIVNTFGTVETGVITSTRFGWRPESVGRPPRGVEVRIAEDGEILVKRPFMMLEYFRDPAATARAIDHDGWFATGDLGRFDDEGFLYITGRKKDLIIPAGQGRIFPQVIEEPLIADPAISQVMVCGEGKPYLVALVVPQKTFLQEAAARIGLSDLPIAALADHPAIRSLYLDRIRAALRHLPESYQIREVALLAEPWTVEGGELTEDLHKLRRGGIAAKYGPVIEALYRLEQASPQCSGP